MPARGKPPEEDLSFEALYAALEEKARRLEEGHLSLEESIRLYEEGADLVARLRDVLGAAELRIRTVQARLQRDEADLREVEAEYLVDDDD